MKRSRTYQEASTGRRYRLVKVYAANGQFRERDGEQRTYSLVKIYSKES